MTGDEAGESTDDLRNVVDRAVESGDLETLSTALTQAGLVETLKGAGPFTVFAPTDEAFGALPDGALDELPAAPRDSSQRSSSTAWCRARSCRPS